MKNFTRSLAYGFINGFLTGITAIFAVKFLILTVEVATSDSSFVFVALTAAMTIFVFWLVWKSFLRTFTSFVLCLGRVKG
jgi:hypothetical protein